MSEVYPPDAVLTQPYYDDPNRWLVFLHCIGIGYMLLGLNTVCDVYFTGALEVMVEKWKIKPDVAGATFMAAGGSAPELFTSLIGAQVESDVGFSTIVGSAVFNVLFVIGLCGVFAKEEMVLTWWPLFRDCTYYIFGLILLASFASDGQIVLAEAIVLFVCYLIYCVIMYHNQRIEGLVDSRLRRSRKQVAPTEPTAGAPSVGDGRHEGSEPDEKASEIRLETVDMQAQTTSAGEEGEAAAGEEEEEDALDFINRPDGRANSMVWAASLPVYTLLYFGTPRPTEKRFLLTFLVSLFWIAGFSFLLVWWVEILGDIIFKGSCSASIVMGFTILAAGTSIPDAVSSVAVAKVGEGDMAVSSSIGSNIFDILVGLPIPWIIKILTGLGDGHPHVGIGSPFLFFYVVLLLIMVILTVSSIHFLGWRLDKRLGVMMAALYGLFLTIALSTEFGHPTWLMWGSIDEGMKGC